MIDPIRTLRADPEDLDAALDALEQMEWLAHVLEKQLTDKPVAALVMESVQAYIQNGRANLGTMIMRRSDRLRDVQRVH